MAEECEINVIRWNVCLDDAVYFLGLPVDDAGNYEGKAATGTPLLKPIAAVESSPMPIFKITRQGVNLLSLEQASPITFSHIRIGHETQGVFGTNHPAKLTVGAVEEVLS